LLGGLRTLGLERTDDGGAAQVRTTPAAAIILISFELINRSLHSDDQEVQPN
jgi:hypothetical protein